MNWNKAVRQPHRWMSMTSTVTTVVTVVAMTQEKPGEWSYYLPLLPLALLLLTGLDLFVIPYLTEWRGRRTVDGLDA